MATAAIMQLRKNAGLIFRETGQAMDRMGASIMGDFAYMEPLSRHRSVMGVYDTSPVLGEGAFVAPNASVIGDVNLGKDSSVWYGAVLRGAFVLPPLFKKAIFNSKSGRGGGKQGAGGRGRVVG
eukprot:COSAG05_NODE_2_length_63105_cov_159.292956_12_plen_124_part_00